jgi:hypothetical protein
MGDFRTTARLSKSRPDTRLGALLNAGSHWRADALAWPHRALLTLSTYLPLVCTGDRAP